MWKNIGYERCLSFINCQLSPGGRSGNDPSSHPAITISRMTGSGGRTVAAELAELLQTHAPGHCPWTVFDRNLMEKVLEDHHLPGRLARFAPENRKSLAGDVIEELLGLHPSSWTLRQQTAETVLRIARMGNVILVGRGANVITAGLDNVFHVRLVGSVPRRVLRVQEANDLSRADALKFLRNEDSGRKRYLRQHFKKDIADPLLYHLIMNTDRIESHEAALLIGEEVIRRFHLDRRPEMVED
jgi:cytidylate kinase